MIPEFLLVEGANVNCSDEFGCAFLCTSDLRLSDGAR